MYLKTFDPSGYKTLRVSAPTLKYDSMQIEYFKDELNNDYRKITRGKDVQWFLRWPFQKAALSPKP